MLGWLPGSWSVPGHGAAGHGERKVPSDPAGAHQTGGDGHFYSVGTRAKTWLERGEGCPRPSPSPCQDLSNVQVGLSPSQCLGLPVALVPHVCSWLVPPTLVFPFLWPPWYSGICQDLPCPTPFMAYQLL